MADDATTPAAGTAGAGMEGQSGGRPTDFQYNRNGSESQGGNLPQLETVLKAAQVPTNGVGLPAEPVDLLNLGISDEANAQAVTKLFPHRFVFTSSHGWLQYTGAHWETDTAEATVKRSIVKTLIERIKAAIADDAEKHEKLIKFCVPNAGRVRGALDNLTSLVTVSHKEFDASHDLLNCPNGVVDLRTGRLQPHSPAHRFMHVAGVDYDPAADYSAWENWLTETVGGDPEVIRWLQMAVGYTLTGYTSEEALFYLYGPPRSGKGVFTETLRLVLGEQLARAISFSTLTAPADVDAQNFALAPLKPTRLVLASESNQYERFNEAKLKTITGGDTISCAFKHRDQFNYRPQFKVWLSSNQPINADPDDAAVWGRIRIIEFPTSHLGQEDKSLKARMRDPANLRAVLAWAVQGAVAWYALGNDGLPELPRLAMVKDRQRAEIDHVQQWFDDCCKIDLAAFSATADLYANYRAWCSDNGVTAKQMRGFALSLRAKGFENGQKRLPGKVNPVRGFASVTCNGL